MIYYTLFPQGLLKELLDVCDGQIKSEVVEYAAFYEHRLQQGQKAIYHLEAFVAKFMAIYKRFLEEGIADLFWMLLGHYIDMLWNK